MKKFVLNAGIALAATVALSTPAEAIRINLIDQGGVTGSQAQEGFRIAAAFWENILTNNVTVNLGVSYASLGAGIIGSTGSSANDMTVGAWEAGFNATKSNSALDQSIVLPTLTNGGLSMITSGPRNTTTGTGVNAAAASRVYDTDNSVNNRVLYLNTANVKAVGGTATYDATNTQRLDGEIQFSSNFGFDFDPTNGISANTFDFIGTAIHEMGHALGFVSGVDYYDYVASLTAAQSTGFRLNQTSVFSALDMFRYSNDPTNLVPGTNPVLDFSVAVASYFSIDGGRNQLFGDSRFATGAYRGDGQQASHWKDNTAACTPQLGIMDPTDCYAQLDEVTALDLAAFDAMGWNLSVDVLNNSGLKITTADIYRQYATAVPEPTTWAMLIAGFGVMGGALRRRARQTVRVTFA